jgi:outer membrane receptor for ferrienterochelin and colicin
MLSAPLLSLLLLLPRQEIADDVADVEPAGMDSDVEDLGLRDLLDLTVSTASLRAQPFVWAPNNSIVVTRRQIRTRGYISLKDLLADLPGIDVYNNFSEELSALISVRGNVGNSTFVILENGRRVSMPTGEPWPIDHNYPVFNAKQVEVIFGPTSALYGTDALSGIVNIITDDPSSSDVRVSLSYGANNSLYGTGRVHVQPVDRLTLELTGHYQRSDNSNLASEYPGEFPARDLIERRDPYSGELLGGLRADQYDHGTSSLSFNARARWDETFTLGYDERRFNMPTSNGVIAPYTDYGPEAQFISQLIHVDFTDYFTPSLKNKTSVSYSIFRFGSDYSFRNFYSGFSEVYKHMNSQLLTLNQQLTYDLTEEHSLIGGISFLSGRSQPYTLDLTKKPDTGTPLSAQGYFIPGTNLPAPFYDVNLWSLGAFAQAQSKWADWISTTVGARIDYDNRYGATVNPRASAVLRIGSDHTLKLLYGEGFQAPSTYNQYPLFGTFNDIDAATGKPRADFYHLPNPDLDPLKTRTAELVDTFLIGEELLFTFSGYYSQVHNGIVNVFSTERVEFAGGLVDGAERSYSIADSVLYGGTAAVNYKTKIGEVAIDSWLSYTLSLGTSNNGPDTEQLELAYNTKHKVKGGVTLQYETIYLTTSFRYNGAATHSSFVDEAGTERLLIPGSLVIDSSLLVDDVLPGASFSLTARNLLDQHYYAPGSYTIVNMAKNPQETRQIMMTVMCDF